MAVVIAFCIYNVFFLKELSEHRMEKICDKLVWMVFHRFWFDLIWLPESHLIMAIIRLNLRIALESKRQYSVSVSLFNLII